ncbi:heme peroxidase [Lindgomyces ingoldianus]|uniref:Heme peroxidase n=1 Tax=Lindgomyces ingoldianus TaxID=673940 RepID=A0ACB6QJV9_9PLEO|nr:heme peroxidase [Lindgomyces ingoldianus]KAF2466602.1 heme peroxidase [Lindgomyces ingoldianus]
MFRKFVLALPLLSVVYLAIASPVKQRSPAPGLIDDLLKGVLSPIGQLIKDILNGITSGQSGELSSKPLICLPSLDECCVWWDVSADLTSRFKGPDSQCNDNARAAVRMGFHDAGSWDKNSLNGGADGSLLMDFGEQDRPENNGLQSIRNILRTVQAKYKVGYADLAQYAHNHATVTCPKGPRIRTFIGRKDATKAAPTGLLPDTRDSADNLITLFQNKGFSAHDLAALVGAHSSAKQRFVDPSKANFPLDTTPGVWDVNFYNETLENPPDSRIFVLPSDKALSTHPKITDEWNAFVGNQPHWNEDYAKAYVRMSLLGVDNLDDLSECTKTLPVARVNGV